MAKTTKLEALREHIDQLDDQIHDLIMQRWTIVSDINRQKSQQKPQAEIATLLPIRPEREASMYRRLAARHKGPFELSALFRMWQEMIACYTQLQAPFEVAVVANENRHALWDLARDRFGQTTRLTRCATARECLNLMSEAPNMLAVLPFPVWSDQEDPWWTHLTTNPDLQVVMHLPFFESGSLRMGADDAENPRALVVARAKAARSGYDRSLLVVESDPDISRSGLVEAVNGLKPSAQVLAIGPDNEVLAEVNGFMTSTHMTVMEKNLMPFCRTLHFIGSYQTGLSLEEDLSGA